MNQGDSVVFSLSVAWFTENLFLSISFLFLISCLPIDITRFIIFVSNILGKSLSVEEKNYNNNNNTEYTYISAIASYQITYSLKAFAFSLLLLAFTFQHLSLKYLNEKNFFSLNEASKSNIINQTNGERCAIWLFSTLKNTTK